MILDLILCPHIRKIPNEIHHYGDVIFIKMDHLAFQQLQKINVQKVADSWIQPWSSDVCGFVLIDWTILCT